MTQGSQTDLGFDELNQAIRGFLDSNYDVEKFKEACEHLLLLTKADFVDLMVKNVKTSLERKSKRKRIDSTLSGCS